MADLSSAIDGLPNISGAEQQVEEALAAARGRPVFYSGDGGDPFAGIRSAFSIALHMHQPLIPAGGDDLHTARLISNLQYMQEHPDIEDNHNASVFRWCYQRMAEFIPELLSEGRRPGVMLEYSGTLLWGLQEMGASDVLDGLRSLAVDPSNRSAVEFLGCPWGHAVAPSTPVQDFRLHVRAWQNHFASLFGLEAVSRVRGFSPAEMALPNHPDVGYEFVRTLNDCGFQWVLVQEHTVETPEGRGIERPHYPHRLVCTSSTGETASIVALVKTQGSDTKLVAQMQPYYEALTLDRQELAGRQVPPLVTQIADGENGGVMMNEFPSKYLEVMREASGSPTPILNGTEYLERLFATGLTADDLPVIQPLFQNRIWQRMAPGDGTERLSAVVADLGREDDRFHMDGGSWTSDISWVRGYDQVLIPMDQASVRFHEVALSGGVSASDSRYRNALLNLLAAETSCYRYWGAGRWTDYGAELARRTNEILTHDLAAAAS